MWVYSHLVYSPFHLLPFCFLPLYLLPIFLAHLSRRLVGELIGYSWSGVSPSVVCRPSVHNAQRSSPPIKAKFYVEPPWIGGRKVCLRHLGHMTKMATMPIYGKNPSKIFFSRTGKADFHETWYVASGTPAHHSLFK